MGQDLVQVIDEAFVQLPEHRPKPVISEADGIPIIDLSSVFSETGVSEMVVKQVETACRDWGFFQVKVMQLIRDYCDNNRVINHGISPELLKRAEEAEKAFFNQSEEEKKKVKRDELNPLGFYESEHTKNVRDWKEVFDFVVHEPDPDDKHLNVAGLVLKNKWPQVPLGFKEIFEEYAEAVEKLSFKLLELISQTLNLPPKRLNPFFEEQTSFIRLNHYPPCPYPRLTLGVGRHKDAGALTVLYQDDTGGLDVKRRADGEWIRVKPIANSFIVNVGDIIQVWSNDKYESAEHRVSVNSQKDRFSIPFFFNPASHTNVKPLEELINDKNPGKYDEYNWGEFFKTRKDSNFKKLEVENIQITHFKRTY